MRNFLIIAITLLALPSFASAQAISGVVMDESGAVIRGARVEAVRAKSRKVTHSGDDGSFRIDVADSIAVAWTLHVSAAGFAPATISVQPGGQRPIAVRLQIFSTHEEMAVTARRAEAEVNETAEAVTVFGQERLQEAGAFTLDDQLRESPGFNLFRRTDSLAANPTSQGVSFRGTGASGASRALVLADGVPLNDPFGGWVYWDRIPRASIARVELLEGGASDLYGSTALSGVIDVITRRPQPQWLVLESSEGTRSTPEGSIFAGKDFGGWSFSGSGGGYSTAGYIGTTAANRGVVDTPLDSRDSNADASIFKKYANGSLRLNGLYFHEARDNGTPLQTNDTDIGEGSAHWDQNLRGGMLSGTFFGSGQSYNQAFSSIALGRNSETLTRLQHVPARRLGGGLQWANEGNHRQQWTFGGDAQSVRGTSLETGFLAGRATSNSSAGGTQCSFGAFAQDTIRLNSRLILTGGLRLDHWSNTDAALITRTIFTGATTMQPFADRGQNFVSPHASAMVRLSNSWALTFAGSRSFRAPTLNELYRSFRLGNVLTNANSTLSAEQLFGGEAGVMANVKKLTLRATGFAYQVKDSVSNVTISSTPSLITRQRQNLGETASRGVEVSAGSDMVTNLSWRVGYQFTHAVVDDFPADPTLIGLWVPQVPAHSFTFQTAWNKDSWTIAGQGRASGNQFDDDKNTFPLGRAFTLDALVSKQVASGVTLFVAAQNLTNDRYLTALTPTPQQGAGISARAGVRVELAERKR